MKLPFFENSVRVFFPLAAIIAIFVPMWTTGVLNNGYPFEHSFLHVFDWHAYEMLFGFLLTLATGFILTAAGHWSGKEPLSQLPLVILLALYLFDKIIIYVGLPYTLLKVMIFIFPIYFIYQLNNLLADYVQKTKFLTLFIALLGLKIMFVFSVLEDFDNSIIKNLTIWTYIYLVYTISSRIVPRFTQNYFQYDPQIMTPIRVHQISQLTILFLIFTCFPILPKWADSILYLLAGVSCLLQQSFWHPKRSMSNMLIGMLHVGYALFALGLLFIGISKMLTVFTLFKSDIHLLLTGGISVIGMNMMLRATLGHTGNPLKYTPFLYSIFICLIIGALLRSFIPILYPIYAIKSYHYSMGFWTLGYVFFLIKVIPMVFRSRKS